MRSTGRILHRLVVLERMLGDADDCCPRCRREHVPAPWEDGRRLRDAEGWPWCRCACCPQWKALVTRYQRVHANEDAP